MLAVLVILIALALFGGGGFYGYQGGYYGAGGFGGISIGGVVLVLIVLYLIGWMR